MPDIFTKSKRSEVMSRIRGCGNKETELALILVFRANRITGWRRYQPVFVKPDFVFPQWKLAVFVDGCFWHGCPKHGTRPKSNRKFWDEKIARNRQRDREVNRKLRKHGWRILRIWEHALRKPAQVVRRVARALEPAKPSDDSLLQPASL